MAKYKVGDKVRIVNHRTFQMNDGGGMDKWFGKAMTIKKLEGDGYRMLEDRNEYFGDGWYWNDDMIAGLAEPQHNDNLSVVISFSGNKTTARMIRGETVVKTATARCSPKDQYSHAEGARIAMDRLFEKKRNEGKSKIGDKFVVVGRSGDVFHAFDIDTIVTLIRLECNGCNQYRDDFGLCQYVSDRDVKPYKENGK